MQQPIPPTSLNLAVILEPLFEDSVLALYEVSPTHVFFEDVRALFSRSFRSEPPDFPRHFVARIEFGADKSTGGQSRCLGYTLGYVHHSAMPRCYLGGGMCIDTRAYRALEVSIRTALQNLGGIAHWMLDRSCRFLDDKEAVFGYVGDKRALDVDLRSGFTQTHYPRLIVRWLRTKPSDADALIVEVNAIGPF